MLKQKLHFQIFQKVSVLIMKVQTLLIVDLWPFGFVGGSISRRLPSLALPETSRIEANCLGRPPPQVLFLHPGTDVLQLVRHGGHEELPPVGLLGLLGAMFLLLP